MTQETSGQGRQATRSPSQIQTPQVDLHLHTTASDGRLTPKDLVTLLVSRGIRVAAITDHDSMQGIPSTLASAQLHPSITIIPGVELSTDIPGSEVHLLGYFLDHEDTELDAILASFRDDRWHRARHIVEKLCELGLPVEWQRVIEIANGAAIGRPHIAHAMVERGYISYPQEAFTRYLGRNGMAYVERRKLTPEEAILLVLRFGGLPVLAHPREVAGLEALLPKLVAAGLVGMEVFYGDYPPQEVERLHSLSKQYRIVPCGGSDYHFFGTPGEVEPGQVGPPISTVNLLISLATAAGHAFPDRL